MSNKLHTEDGSDKVVARIPSSLKAEFKREADPNMSAVLEDMIRDYVGQEEPSDGLEPYEEPDDRRLALAYRALCEHHFDGVVRLETAKRALAQKLENTTQEDTYPLFRRLKDMGYCKFQKTGLGLQGRTLIHVRPWSKRQATEAAERVAQLPKPSFEQIRGEERQEQVEVAD